MSGAYYDDDNDQTNHSLGDDDDRRPWDEDGSRPIKGFAVNTGGMREYKCGGSTEEPCGNRNCPRCG